MKEHSNFLSRCVVLAFALGSGCGPSPSETTSTGESETDTSSTNVIPTSSGTNCDSETNPHGDPNDEETALACEGFKNKATCNSADEPQNCRWFESLFIPMCTGGCMATEPDGVCIALQSAETTCPGECDAFWRVTQDGLRVVRGIPCLTDLVGWHYCGLEERPECECGDCLVK